MIRCAVIIPARYGSTRLPGKVLLKETGKYLIQHVYEIAAAAKGVDLVAVATDDEKVMDACKSFGARAIMTPATCASGTHRVAIACRKIEARRMINFQGDEPELPSEIVSRLATARYSEEVGTVATSMLSDEDFGNRNRVKVVVADSGKALYFSRSPIPYNGKDVALLHIGLYSYSKAFLQRAAKWKPAALAQKESLEQLTWLQKGCNIHVEKGSFTSFGGIDTPDDYSSFVERYRKR